MDSNIKDYSAVPHLISLQQRIESAANSPDERRKNGPKWDFCFSLGCFGLVLILVFVGFVVGSPHAFCFALIFFCLFGIYTKVSHHKKTQNKNLAAEGEQVVQISDIFNLHEEKNINF